MPSFFVLGNSNLATSSIIDLAPLSGVRTRIVSDSSSPTTTLFLIMLALGGGVWMVKQSFESPPKPAKAPVVEEADSELSTAKRAVDFSQATGDALNTSVNDQLKSVQQMAGGTYDGQTYVLPGSKK